MHGRTVLVMEYPRVQEVRGGIVLLYSTSMKKDVSKQSIALHKKLGGKIRVTPSAPIKNKADLSLVYTPGVAAVCRAIAEKPELARDYTVKGKMVAVVSDGSAVLGLKNIGGLASLPVMEGKAALFKTFGGVDAVPIVLSTQNTDEIVETVVRIAPAFGGINLEDIAAPKCFEVERRLIELLDIPVMHDDQHGTAVVVLAALLNALKVVGKDLKKAKILIVGAGAAGVATAKLLKKAGATNILVVDSKGIVALSRTDLSSDKKELASFTNPEGRTGTLQDAFDGADVFLGVSGPNIATAEDVRRMAEKPIVFAMANPTPEISPEEAKKGGAYVIATGRSDYPNQVNNSLAFPGIFKGALENRVRRITDEMKLKAAYAIAGLVKKPSREQIVPDMFDTRLAKAVAKVIR